MTDLAQKAINTWLAGYNVERCHTTPHIHEYRVGLHSWGAAVLMAALWPKATATALKAVLFHDAPEIYTGDVPWTSKNDFQGLHDALDEADKVIRKAGLVFHEDIDADIFDAETVDWIHLVDLMDFWLWSRVQVYVYNNCNWMDSERRARQNLLRREVWGHIKDEDWTHIEKFVLTVAVSPNTLIHNEKINVR